MRERFSLARRAARRLAFLRRPAVEEPAPPPAQPAPPASPAARSARYWTQHNVTDHERFASAEDSLEHFRWRNDQYRGYLELMPVAGHDGQAVLDLGCGPGNDLVGLGIFSAPRRLLGAEVSPTALEQARARAALHGLAPELSVLSVESPELPFETGSIDYVHCSGVLHHVPDETATLRECRRVLRPDGEMRVMVYNLDSLWVHLYVAYVRRIVEGAFADLDLAEAFARSTDGPDCPISRAYRPAAFLEIARGAGFAAEFLGAAVSMWEMSHFARRFDAIMDRRLGREHREFLLELEVDGGGYPVYRGRPAGIGACFSLRPA